ncbi:MAG: autotransporter domain-containing protein [Endomicrobia bacterium]|nr:autotransporter domain-containing protein [Endomicrobiia bacterium]MCL2507462.1 autotransporter domain-containing protein [Endomicrobiia bacterium]
MKKMLLSLLLLSVTVIANAFAEQVDVSSEGELNTAIDNLSVSTITATQGFNIGSGINAISDRNITINTQNEEDFFLYGVNVSNGFYIKNSAVSINNINLSGFRNEISSYVSAGNVDIYSFGNAIYASSSTISYTGNNIMFENNITSASIINTGSGFCNAYARGGAIVGVFSAYSFVSTGDMTFFNNTAYGYGYGDTYYGNGYASGGAIYSEHSTFSFVSFGDINFSFNTASGSGYGLGGGYAHGNGNGGAIYSNYSAYLLASSGNINFLGNTASGFRYGSSGFNSGKGGAIYSSSSSSYSFDSSGDINFLDNTAFSEGGAIYSNYSIFSFVSAVDINFFNNTVSGLGYGNGNGGAICSGSDDYTFISIGDINFLGNTASGRGGAIWSQSAYYTLISSKDINFLDNTASDAGGAIYSESDEYAFISSGDINFSSNTASDRGGAILISNSKHSFVSFNDINFLGNTVSEYGYGYGQGLGGAIHARYDSYSSFVSSGNINFIYNTAFGSGTVSGTGHGGAICSEYESDFYFDSACDINFLNNTASGYVSDEGFAVGFGGAISSILFATYSFVSSGNINFLDNTASGSGSGESECLGSGGAIFGYDSDFLFDSSGDINFINNTVSSSGSGFGAGFGGAIFSLSSEYSFVSSREINFSNNKASGTTLGFGGAVYALDNSIMTFRADTIKFENNTANSLGGAFYITDGSAVSFSALSADMNVLFQNNYAGGVLNDVYISSAFYLFSLDASYGSPSALNFNAIGGNITLSNGIRVDGDGSGTIYKTGSENLIFGGEIIIKNTSFNVIGGEVNLLDNATFESKNMIFSEGTVLNMQNETANTIYTGEYVNQSNLKIDIWANGDNDQIISGKATVGGNLDIKLRVGTYDDREYTLIISSMAAVSGIFVSTSTNLPLNFILNYNSSTDYLGSVILSVSGVYASDFSSRTYSRRGNNHRNTARILDDLSTDDSISDDMADIITELMTRGDREVEDTLLSMSGYFLANVIRSVAGAPANEIYDKIRNHAREDRTNSGLWAQVRGEIAKFAEHDNSPEDYKDSSLGLMIGFDKYIADNGLMWGVYGRFNSHSIEQGQNKADGNNKGLGVYGGLIKEDWELKALVSGSFDNFDTQRYVYTPIGNRIAKGEIEAFTLSGDIEAALKYAMSERVKLRPYVGMEIDDVNYKGFRESGAGAVNLDVNGGNYIRSAARIGAGVEYDKKEWSVYARGEGKYLITGFEPEIESKFEGTNSEFTTKGAEEGKIQIGLGLGGEMFISQNWKLFAHGNYYTAERYENLYGHVGIRYIFGCVNKTKKAEVKEEKAYRSNEDIQKAADKAMKEADETAKAEIEAFKEQEKTGGIQIVEIKEKPKAKVFRLTKVLFDFDKYELKPEGKQAIAGLARVLKEMGYSNITVEGHTDNIGTHEYNMDLSLRRADTVYRKLAELGIDSVNMEKVGHGLTRPIATNKTEEGRAKNRRVEIIVE